MRILMALSGSQMTAQQLAEDVLHDVPQATLYRHIHKLLEAGVILVAAENQVRGTVEKVYTLDDRSANLTVEDLAGLSKEDHMRYFIAYVGTLLDDFSRYLQNTPKVDYLADGVGYHKATLELSDEEMAQMQAAINQAILPYLSNQPAPGRKRRVFSSIVMPDLSKPPKGT